MLEISAAFESHLQGDVTTHCFAWIIRRSDNKIFGFCDHDLSLDIGGVSCLPQSGMNGSEAGAQLGLSVDATEIEGVLVADSISDADIERGFYDGARVETYLVNWVDPQQHILLRCATIGQITRTGHKFIAELKSSAALLDQVFGRRVKRSCDAHFGDTRCGANAYDPAYSGSGRVVVSSQQGFTAEGLQGFTAQWFENGSVVWLSGQNAGTLQAVISHVQTGDLTSFVLAHAPVFPIVTGDEFRATTGCDKSFRQCKERFANQENFRGFPHIPGNDAAYAYVSGQNIFDGGVLVP